MNKMKLSILKHKKQDYTASDLIIVTALGRFGPRNLFKIARYLNMPESTLRYRIKRLRKKDLLKLYTNVYHTNLGLKKSLVFADINPRYYHVIHMFFSIVDYWIYMKRTHGIKEGIYSLYISPVEHIDKIKIFIDEMMNINLIKNYKIIHSTCFHGVNPTTTWYDLKDENWNFKWRNLEDDIEKADLDLPFTLKDPDNYPLLADETDIYILKEMEKDPTVSYAKLAKDLNTTSQNIYYHYKEHIISNKLIEDFQIYFRKFDPRYSYTVFIELAFPSYRYFAKTANALRDKPFVETLGKVIGENKLFAALYIPADELSNMFTEFNELIKLGVISEYEYRLSYILDYTQRQTISYRSFRDGQWIYPHEEYMENLRRMYENIERGRDILDGLKNWMN